MIKRTSFDELKKEKVIYLFDDNSNNKISRLIRKVRKEFEAEHNITLEKINSEITAKSNKQNGDVNTQDLPKKPLDFIQRVISEFDTQNDLKKSIEQLICDVHEETHNNNRTSLENIASAQKRMVSMMGRVAISNEKNNKSTKWLTCVIIILAIIQIVLNFKDFKISFELEFTSILLGVLIGVLISIIFKKKTYRYFLKKKR
jgi:formate dehydrogenase maturation protein FdhE